MTEATRNLLEQHFDTAFAAPDGIAKLRELILTLAIQGRLVEQDPSDTPASELLKEIQAEKQRLVKAGKIKKSKPLPPIKPEEVPYKLPKGWEWVRLGDALIKITDGTHHSPPNEGTGDFLYISAKNIKDDGVIVRNATYVTKEIHEKIFSRCDPEYGNILYIKDGATTGIVTINNLKKPFSMLSSVALLKQPRQIINRYLLFTLRAPYFYEAMRTGMTGVAITRVTLRKLQDAIIPLPPLAQQHRIVARIDQLMARCDELEMLRKEREEKRLVIHAAAINQLLDAPDGSAWNFIQQYFEEFYTVKENVAELRKAILQLAVMGRLVPQNPDDPPASELLKEIKTEKQRVVKAGKTKKSKPLPPIKPEEVPFKLPQGWKWVRLGEIAEINGGFAFKSSRYTDDGIRVIRISDFNERGFRNDKIVRYPYSDDLSGFFLEPNNILMAMTGGTVGKSFLVKLLPEPMFVNQRVATIKLPKGIVPEFINGLIRTELIQSVIQKSKNSTNDNISMGAITGFFVPLPPVAEQQRIVAQIEQLMTRCDTLDQHIDAATGKKTQLLKAIMVQYKEIPCV